MNKALWMLAPLMLLACDSDLPTGIGGTTPVDLPDGTIGNPDPDADDDPTDTPDGHAAAGEDNTFDHPDALGGNGKDPFEILAERQEEGPPEIRTRLHSCQKLQYAALGNTLRAFGVDTDASGDPPPAGQLWRDGRDALGAANYGSRTGEAITWTNSGATKFQDIWVMAAAEIIANIATAEHCMIDGVGVEMFDADDNCNEPAVTCLIGRPATEDHLLICNQIVHTAADIEQGKQLAVAALLAGAHTCE